MEHRRQKPSTIGITTSTARAFLLAVAVLLLGGGTVEAALTEDALVYRAELVLQTCSAKDAGTNEAVFAELNGANRTYLDYPGRDFPGPDDTFVYDLVWNNVVQARDIDRLMIGKHGRDRLCLRLIALLINDRVAYAEYPAEGVWIDDDHPHLLSGWGLRRNYFWRRYPAPFNFGTVDLTDIPTVISREWIESAVTALVATQKYGRPTATSGPIKFFHLYWTTIGDRAVAARRSGSNVVSINLDLKAKMKGWGCTWTGCGWKDDLAPDPVVNVDFDLAFSCDASTGQLRLQPTLRGVDVEFTGVLGIAYDLIWDVLDIIGLAPDLADEVAGGFSNITFGVSSIPWCPRWIDVTAESDVEFYW